MECRPSGHAPRHYGDVPQRPHATVARFRSSRTAQTVFTRPSQGWLAGLRRSRPAQRARAAPEAAGERLGESISVKLVAARPWSPAARRWSRRTGGSHSERAPPRAGQGAATSGPRVPGRSIPARRRATASPATRSASPPPRAARRARSVARPHRDRARERARYGSRKPFLNPHGHRLYAAHARPRRPARGAEPRWQLRPRRRARPRPRRRRRVSDRRTVDGAAIAVWGTGQGRAHPRHHGARARRTLSAGVEARRPDGLRDRAARRAALPATSASSSTPTSSTAAARARASGSRTSTSPGVSRPSPGSSNGRAEACVWIGNRGLGAPRARPLVRLVGPVDRAPRRAAPRFDADRRRRRPHRRLHRALHPRQHVPPPADRARRPRRADRRVGRPELGPPAGERRQRDRGQPLRELARRRLPRRGDHAHDGAPQHVRRPGVGGDRRLPRRRQPLSTATTSAASAPAAQAVRHDHLSSIREG